MAHVVVGGVGFTGLHLANRLSEAGASVIVADVRPPPFALPSGAKWCHVDLLRPESVATLPVSPEDVVYHLAARQYHAGVPSKGRDSWFAALNVGGTENLLDHIHRQGCNGMVFFSSDMVYGRPANSPVGTHHPLHPLGPYGRSKKQAEEICQRFRDRGMRITILRPRLIIGPGRLGILERLFSLIRRGLPVPVIGSGNNRYQMVSVHDCVSAARLAVKSGLPNEEFNLGSEDPPRVADLLGALIRAVKSRSILVPTPAAAVKAVLTILDRVGLTLLYPEQFAIADIEYIVDIAETKCNLGWAPRYRDADMLLEAYETCLLRHPIE